MPRSKKTATPPAPKREPGKSFRLGAKAEKQLAELAEHYGQSATAIIRLAIFQLFKAQIGLWQEAGKIPNNP